MRETKYVLLGHGRFPLTIDTDIIDRLFSNDQLVLSGSFDIPTETLVAS